MITRQDEIFLRRALRLAMNGRGHVEPNPMVGCVLAKNGQTIGEGWHQKYGQPHAEPNALADCKSRGHDPAGATAYVTLEPCCHTNKQTPPCAPRLIEAKIARVVIGCLDPNPDVNGKGVAMLRAAGIDVDVMPISHGTGLRHVNVNASRAGGPCHEDLDGSHFQQLVAPFILRQKHARPYVTLKWAQTADGKVAGTAGRRLQISNDRSSRFVHQLRARSDAIMVGVDTILNDDPQLSARGVDESRLGRIYILDSAVRTPPGAKVFGHLPVTVFMSSTPIRSDGRMSRAYEHVGRAGLEVRCRAVEGDVDGRLLLDRVFALGLGDLRETHLLVEAGPTLARSFFESGLCDRLIVIRSPRAIDEPTALQATSVPLTFTAAATLDFAGDRVTEYFNTESPAFFAAVPSADLVLASASVARASGT